MSDKIELTQQLNLLHQQQFTGRIDIRSNAGQEWRLYFYLNRLVWAEGGFHPQRAWRRHLAQYCPHVQKDRISLRQSDDLSKVECRNYYLLTILLKRQQITREQVTAIIQSMVDEVLFDILEQEASTDLNYSSLPMTINSLVQKGIEAPLAPVAIKAALQKARQSWTTWCQRGMADISPNSAPSIKKPQQLQQEVPETVYQKFVYLLDGVRTLRDLGALMKQDVLRLTLSLNPYIQKGLIELAEISDQPQSGIVSSATETFRPLIACIDDSPQINKVMEQILTEANYRYIGIQESLKAVPALIACDPSLIFLDLGMPIINGYEICTQLRRISKLQEVPIVILTGNDGIVDRMRAKFVGASGFLSKPISVEKILDTVEKFLAGASDTNGEGTLEERQIPEKLSSA